MTPPNTPASKLLAIAVLILVFGCTFADAGQRRATMQVSCTVLPYISLELNGQKPEYGSMAATVVSEPGELQLTGKTNDPQVTQFVLTATSTASAVVNDLEVAPGEPVEVGRYSYGAPIVLSVTAAAPVRLTASR